MPAQIALDHLTHLNNLGNVVPEGYTYYQKKVSIGPDLDLPTAYLKWYNLYPTEAVITPEQVAESQDYLKVITPDLNLQNELGFVILHRAGTVLLLLLCTWRNTNEIWESSYVKDLEQAGGYEPITALNNHRGTFCVWELGPVWHERNAWVQFLSSKRDTTAKMAYLTDRFMGMI
jgi:hypothetical protein